MPRVLGGRDRGRVALESVAVGEEVDGEGVEARGESG